MKILKNIFQIIVMNIKMIHVYINKPKFNKQEIHKEFLTINLLNLLVQVNLFYLMKAINMIEIVIKDKFNYHQKHQAWFMIIKIILKSQNMSVFMINSSADYINQKRVIL